MKWQIHNMYGMFHVLTGIIAIIAALFIFFSRKGTLLHKKAGYMYVASMLILNISAWGVMEFNTGKPGPFHIGTLVSLTFLFMGMYPVIRRNKNWLQKHYTYINGSVTGLFAAFFVEIVFRSFSDGLVVIGLTIGISLLVAGIGTYLIIRNKPKFFPKRKLPA